MPDGAGRWTTLLWKDMSRHTPPSRPARSYWHRASAFSLPRERVRVLAQSPEHHLPSQVDDRHLDGLGIRRTHVALQQRGHRHLRRGNRVTARAAVSVHRLQLDLKRLVEQLVSALAQEPEQLSRRRPCGGGPRARVDETAMAATVATLVEPGLAIPSD